MQNFSEYVYANQMFNE